MTERRILSLLLLAVVGQLLLVAAQLPGRGGESSVLASVALRVMAPPSRLVAATVDGVEHLRTALRRRDAIEAENADLRRENLQLRLERARLYGLELQLENLSRALDYTAPPPGVVRVADVVYVDHLSWLRTLVVYLPPVPGQAALLRGSPVTSHDGLVGRVLSSPGSYARVQLITDRASSVGAMIERTRRQGIVRGADIGLLELDYVPLQAEVRPGDRVLTAGIDGVYPQGIPIGSVVAVEPGGELFHRIRVQPAVDFGHLAQVYVLLRGGVPEQLKGASSSASP